MTLEREKRDIKKPLFYANLFLFFGFCFFAPCGPTRLISFAGKNFPVSFYLSLASLPLFYVCYFFVWKKRNVNFLFRLFLPAFAILAVSSLGMSFVLTPRFSGDYGTEPLKEWVSTTIKYIYDLAIIPYIVFFFSILDKKTIVTFLRVFISAWISFGLFQSIVFFVNKPWLNNIYSSLDLLKIFQSVELMERIRLNYGTFRFYGFGSEPASNCILIPGILLPYLSIRLLRFRQDALSARIETLLQLLFVLAFAVLTKSSSVYVGVFVFVLSLLVCFAINGDVKRKTMIICVSAMIGFAILVFVVPGARTIVSNGFGKLIDSSDYSTQNRYSTIWNDFQVFIRNPIFGVGDENQGFFYRENVINTWMSRNPETQAALEGKVGLVAGGAAIPSLISGFGIVGVIIVFIQAKSFIHYRNVVYGKMRKMKSFIISSFIVLLFLSIATIGIHRNYLLFISIASPFLFTEKSASLENSRQIVLEHFSAAIDWKGARPSGRIPHRYIEI